MPKDKNAIEQHLFSAVGQMVPDDMYERITQNIVNEERTMYMNTITTAPKRRTARWIGIAAAACAACLVFICGALGVNYYLSNWSVDSIVDIDVNPGIEIQTNRNDVVLDVTAVNSDAEKVLDGMNLKNTELKVAVNAIIGSMVLNGYLTDGENSILVTVQNDDAQRAEYVRNLILSDIDASLKNNNITASVVNQTVSESESAAAFAEEHNISFGKAVFILNLCAKDSALQSETLAKMSLREIAELVVERNIDIRDIVDYDAEDSIWENIADTVEELGEDNSASQSNTAVTAEKAKEIALAHSKTTVSDAAFIRAELDVEDGVQVYDIAFTAGNVKYEYEINAETGAVLSVEGEKKNVTGSSSGNRISADKAKEVCLGHAGVSADQAVFEKTKLDVDDGLQVYEMEFAADNAKYEYEINALSGEILSFSQKFKSGTASSAGNGNTATEVTAAKAKEIAIQHAGVSSGEATFIKVELDREDGVQVYEIEFCVRSTEYEYEIRATDGSILHYESDYHD